MTQNRFENANLDQDPLGTTRLNGQDLHITNEFAEVVVRRVFTHNGVRLEISSPRLGRCIRLDALQLESLTWQQAECFSTFLKDPFGPSPFFNVQKSGTTNQAESESKKGEPIE